MDVSTWERVTTDFKWRNFATAKGWSDVARQVLRQKVGTYWGQFRLGGRFVAKITREKGVKHLQLTHSVRTRLGLREGWQLAREEWVLDAISGLGVWKTTRWWTDAESLSGEERSWTPDTIVRSQFLSEKKAWNSPPAGQLGFWGPIDEPPKIGSIWEQMQSLPLIEVKTWNWLHEGVLAERILNARRKSEAVCFMLSDLLHLAVLTYREDTRSVRFFQPRRSLDKTSDYAIFSLTVVQDLKTGEWHIGKYRQSGPKKGSLEAAYDQENISWLLWRRPVVIELTEAQRIIDMLSIPL